MQKLLLLFISSSYDVEVLIPISYTFSKCRSCFSCSFYLPLMQKFLSFFCFTFFLFLLILPSSNTEVLILVDFTVLLCRRYYSCSFMLLPCRDFYFRSVHVHRMLFSLFIPPISNVEDVIFLHFIFLLWRNCYSCSFHLLLMPKLLLSFILFSLYAGVSTLVSFNFAPCTTCYFSSFHLLPMQNLLFSFISHSSSFYLPIMEKL